MRNPKTIAGLVILSVLLVALGILIGQMIPTIGEVRLEMSLTPTPEPVWPDSVMAETPDPSKPTAEPVLRSGMTGQTVKDLQSRLYALGYYSAEIDGQFGAATRDAVIAFQQRNGLDADGIVGKPKQCFSPRMRNPMRKKKFRSRCFPINPCAEAENPIRCFIARPCSEAEEHDQVFYRLQRQFFLLITQLIVQKERPFPFGKRRSSLERYPSIMICFFSGTLTASFFGICRCSTPFS